MRSSMVTESAMASSLGRIGSDRRNRRQLRGEFGGFFRALGGIALAVAVRPNAGEMTALDDQIFVADRPSFEEAFEDLARARGIARLGRQRAARNVRSHSVMRHGSPHMVARRRLGEPHVAGIAGELTAL